MKNIIALIIFSFIISQSVFSQCSGWTNLQLKQDTFNNPAFGNATTPERDKLGNDYVYLASTANGVKVYDISSPGFTPIVSVIDTSLLNGLPAINLFQEGIYLYVTLGGIWGSTDEAGLAIIDVSIPSSPLVLDVYSLPGSQGGAGVVAIRGDYAYLGAMGSGLVILDITNKSNIQFVSQLPLLNDFPHSPSMTGSADLYNARGIAIKDTIAYIAYDRGGLRLVSIANLNAHYLISQYAFANLIDKATAYNNVVIYDTLAFVAIDYYGLEILNISDPQNITQVAWWHPATWAPATNDVLVWGNAEGHTNELAYDSNCQKLYISAGRSDLIVLDVSDLNNVTTCETHGSTTDNYATWGLDLYQNNVYIAYIWAPLAPLHSNFTGIRGLEITPCTVGVEESALHNSDISIYPNPAKEQLTIKSQSKIKCIKIYDLFGRLIKTVDNSNSMSESVNISGLIEGIYIVSVSSEERNSNFKFIKK